MTARRARGHAVEAGCELPSQRRRSVARRATVAAAIFAGAGLTVWLLSLYGWRSIASTLSKVGLGGLAIFCGYTLGVFVLLGWCWFLVAPSMSYRKLPAFVFGRLLREAAADVLPFSQLGGFVLGARGVSLLGLSSAVAIASCAVDLGAEVVGQLMFTVSGLAILIGRPPPGMPNILPASEVGVGVLVLGVLAGLGAGVGRPGLRFLRWVIARSPRAVLRHVTVARRQLRRLGRRPFWLLAAVTLHFGAWLMAAGGVWLMLNLLGAPLGFRSVMAMESLIYLLRSLAFVVPGAVGVLEGGYVLLGPVFGLPPEVALSLSLLKRARDLVLGLPVVLAWQLLEGRRMMSGDRATRRSARRAGATGAAAGPSAFRGLSKETGDG